MTILLDVLMLSLIGGNGTVPADLVRLPLARESAIRVCASLHLAHPREWPTGNDAAEVVRWSHGWLRDNPGAPDLSWLDSLPSVAELHAGLALSDALRVAYDTGRIDVPQWRKDEIIAAIVRHRWYYETMLYARDEVLGRAWGQRRLDLCRLLVAVGEAAFVTAAWPAPVPLWAIPETR